ncbi:MAG: hypothetical protein AAF682_32895, partial [Planctomycetota bacterium]
MSPTPREELETAVSDLGLWVRSKKKPTRHHARAVLIAFGRWIEDGEPSDEEVAAVAAAIGGAVTPLGEAWEAAAHDELILACTE